MRLFILIGALLGCSGALAQTFPTATLRVVVPNPPGVPNDTLTRGMLEPLSKAFGRTVLIDNRVGADGILGMETCMRAAPDGHTLCSTTSGTIVVNAAVRQKLPFDSVKDFAGVAFMGFFDSVLAAHASVPAGSVKELVDLARAKPGSLVWGHFGLNSTGNFYQQWIRRSREAEFLVVPYKTTSQVLQAMRAGEVHAMVFSWPNLLTHIRAGKVKPLAVTSDRRLPFLPDVPTFDEEGIKLPLRGWFAYHAPSAMPRPLVMRWHKEIRAIAADATYQEKYLRPLGMSGSEWSPEELDAFVRDQIVAMRDLMKYIGIKPE